MDILDTFGNTISNAFETLKATDVLIPLSIIILTPIMAHLVSRAFFRLETTSMRTLDITRQRIARNVTIVIIYLVGLSLLMYVIPPLRALAVGLFASVGILGIVVGLAAQDSLANFIAGVTLALYRPFRVGDRLKILEDEGIVEDITLRHTIIKTWENKRIIIPNHILSKESIINYTIEDNKILACVSIGISYDSDIDLARKIMVEETKKQPLVIQNVPLRETLVNTPGLPVVRLSKYGDSSIRLKLLFWVADRAAEYRASAELNECIKKRFDKEGVEIPLPYRTIVYKKDIPKPKKLKDSKARRKRKK